MPDPRTPSHHFRPEHPSQNGHPGNGQQALTPVLNPTAHEHPDDWSSLTRETMDTMPRAWTRGLLYFLVVFAAIILPWSMLSKVDEVGTARGQLEPKGKTFKLDAPVTGEVAAINVKEGQTLTAGQVLIELKSELSATEMQQAQAKLDGQLNRLAQLKVMRAQLQGVTTQIQRQQGNAETASQQAQIEEIQQRISYGTSMRDLAQERLQREQQEVERFQKLAEEGIIAQVQVVQAQRAADEARKNLTQANLEVKQAEAQLTAQQSQLEGTARNQELTLLETTRQAQDLESQIVELNGEIAQTKTQMSALKLQLQQRQIRSPIAGILYQLPIDRPGAVVQVGQPIAQIAPEQAPLVLRANMSSQESGFLTVGMPVKVKFDAYPFQDYGIVEGRVTWVAPNAKPMETSAGAIAQTYELEVTLNKPYIQAANKQITLTPGQTATAEVIVRQRRIIDFFLDPFKQLQAGGVKL